MASNSVKSVTLILVLCLSLLPSLCFAASEIEGMMESIMPILKLGLSVVALIEWFVVFSRGPDVKEVFKALLLTGLALQADTIASTIFN